MSLNNEALTQSLHRLETKNNQLRKRVDEQEAIIFALRRIKNRLKLTFTVFAWLSFLLALLMTFHDYIMRLLVGTKYFSCGLNYSIGTKQITAIVAFLFIGLICLRVGRK